VQEGGALLQSHALQLLRQQQQRPKHWLAGQKAPHRHVTTHRVQGLSDRPHGTGGSSQQLQARVSA
jgi:hypothetical protein